MINIGYRLARIQGDILRCTYTALLPILSNKILKQEGRVAISVYSFSGQQDLPEQIASIRSFIYHVGIPERFIVVSDGTHSHRNLNLLSRIHPCVQIVELDQLVKPVKLPKTVVNYAKTHPLGKKLSLLISIPVKQPTIYTDSDVLFFSGADKIIDLANLNSHNPYYLVDCYPALDERLTVDTSQDENPISVNSGFILFKSPVNWDIAIDRLSTIGDDYDYFTEQTIVHLAMHFNRGISLPSDEFIVSREDELIYQDRYAQQDIVLRHYVKPVRHKLWKHVFI